MSRPEFSYPRSILERVGDWIGQRLDELFNRTPDVNGPHTAVGSGIGSLLGWLLVVVALAVVVFVVVMVVRRWVPKVRTGEDAPSVSEVEHRRAASVWAGEAARYEAAGEWKLAMRARFRELVRTLVDRSQVVDLSGRTTGEMVSDMAASTPGATEDFTTAVILFELPWYGDAATGEAENSRFHEAAAAVLAAEVTSRIDHRPTERVGRVRVGAKAGSARDDIAGEPGTGGFDHRVGDL